MGEKKSSVKKEEKKEIAPKEIDPIRSGVNQMMGEFKVPEEFVRVYKESLIMSKLFQATSWGENFYNLTYQVQRLLSSFGVKTGEFDAELAKVYVDYMKVIQSAQQELLKKVQSNESPPQGGEAKK